MKRIILPFVLFSFLFCFSCTNKETNTSEVELNAVKDILVVDLLKNSSNLSEQDLLPVKTKDGERFIISIVQSGEYFEYYDVFESFVQGLQTIGWIKDVALPNPQDRTVSSYLVELEKIDYSDYIQFNSEEFFNFDWDDANIPLFKKTKLFKGEDKASLVLVLGTFACDALLKNGFTSYPMIADAVSDPVGAGVIPSIDDSGLDNFTVRCDPDVYYRQLKLFHDVTAFKKLGVLYEDTVSGRSYGAYADVERFAKEAGFEIVRYTKVLSEPTEDELLKAQSMYLKGLEEICPKVDAIYLSVCGGLEDDNISKVMDIINKYKLPSFAMEGTSLVKIGVLLGVSSSELRQAGVYNAKKAVAIFKGAKPRSLNQLFANIPSIAINLKAANNIDYDIPLDILGSSDEIYTEIEVSSESAE